MEIEFAIINEEEIPPLVVKMGDTGKPKVIINSKHRIWLSLNRGLIAGIFEVLPTKLTDLLDSYLREQYAYEKMENEEHE